jgi:hypothetical protein
MAEKEVNNLEWLQEKGRLREQPFTSNLPLFGPLVVWLRTAWNNVAAKWVLRSLMQQQNEFNNLVVRQIAGFEEQIAAQVITQDREQTALTRDIGELGVQVQQMLRLLQDIDGRLARLEDEHRQVADLEEE